MEILQDLHLASWMRQGLRHGSCKDIFRKDRLQEDPAMLRDLDTAVRCFGRTAFSFDVLEAPERYAIHASQRVPGALVPYRTVGGVDAVIGEPLAPEDRLAEVTHEFLAARRAAKRCVIGFCASEAFAQAAVEAGGGAAQITAEPELDPLSYEPIGGSAKKLRAYARRLRRSGMQVASLGPGARVPTEFAAPADALIERWKRLAVRNVPHILEVEPWRLACEKRYFAVFDPKSADRMWSLLIAHPVYAFDGWHLCHLVRDPDAPKGVTELAVLAAIEQLGDEGVRYATFGPYAAPRVGEFRGFGRLAELAMRCVYRLAAATSGFDASGEFYRKVQADPWRPRYLVIHPSGAVSRGIYAMMRLSHVVGTLA